MYFYKAMKEKQISCSECCFVNSCAGFRKKKKNLNRGMLRVFHIKGHSEIT